MKKLISLMLVLAMCVLAFASCGACDHDYDEDGVCTKCGEKDDTPDDPDTPDTPDDPDAPTAPLTADEWAALFTYTNVTVSVAEQGAGYGSYRFVGGNVYMGIDDVWRQIPSGYEDSITYMFDFADDFAKFELKDGVYTSTEGITLDPEFTHGDVIVASNIRVSISGGKITSIVYDWSEAEEDEIDTGALSFTFADYGTTVAPDVSGPAPDDGGIGGGAAPDPNPDPGPAPDQPGSGNAPTPDELSEAEWANAFDFSNVTITVTQNYTDIDEPYTETTIYCIVGDDIYGLFGDEWSKAPAGYVSSITYSVDFSKYYSEFTYTAGKYCADKITFDFTDVAFVPDGYSEVATLVELMFNEDGKLAYASYDYSNSYGVSGSVVIVLSDYGMTEAPDMSGVGGGNSGSVDGNTYTGNDITFEFEEGFVQNGHEFYKGNANFNVTSLVMDSASASVYNNLDNINFESTLLPAMRPALDQQGITVNGWNVMTMSNDYVEFLVIVLLLEYNDVDLYQAQLIVPITETCFTQITCTTLYGDSDEFIGVIADSVRYAE